MAESKELNLVFDDAWTAIETFVAWLGAWDRCAWSVLTDEQYAELAAAVREWRATPDPDLLETPSQTAERACRSLGRMTDIMESTTGADAPTQGA